MNKQSLRSSDLQKGFSPIVVIILTAFIIGGIIYYIQFKKAETNFQNRVIQIYASSSPNPNFSSTPFPTIAPGEPISFIKSDNTIYIKSNNKIYSKDGFSNGYGEPELVTKEINGNWREITKAPENVISAEIFSFQTLPDNESFIVVLRWNYSDIETYFYNAKTDVIKKLNITSDEGRVFNKIDQFSNDGKYVSFQVFECWNCDGHSPKNVLYNLETAKKLDIGWVSYFKWRDNGNYEYKEQKEKPCQSENYGFPCYEDPKNLPLKMGQM